MFVRDVGACIPCTFSAREPRIRIILGLGKGKEPGVGDLSFDPHLPYPGTTVVGRGCRTGGREHTQLYTFRLCETGAPGREACDRGKALYRHRKRRTRTDRAGGKDR